MVMETPKHTLCRATWIRGEQAEWWEWDFDEERQEYVSKDDGSVMTPERLMMLASVKQMEGWQLCLAVV
jgi:hypothetical protein